MVVVTREAIDKYTTDLREYGEDGDCLRIKIYHASGTSQFRLDFDKHQMDDILIETDGLKVLLDPVTVGELNGGTLHVDREIMRIVPPQPSL